MTHERYGWTANARGEYIRECKDDDCDWPITTTAIIEAIMMHAYEEGTNG